MYFCSSDSSSSSNKLQETSLLYVMYDLEWFFVCRLYDMNAYKILQTEFLYRMYIDTVNTASEEDLYVQYKSRGPRRLSSVAPTANRRTVVVGGFRGQLVQSIRTRNGRGDHGYRKAVCRSVSQIILYSFVWYDVQPRIRMCNGSCCPWLYRMNWTGYWGKWLLV